jgi:hypothetical protein
MKRAVYLEGCVIRGENLRGALKSDREQNSLKAFRFKPKSLVSYVKFIILKKFVVLTNN